MTLTNIIFCDIDGCLSDGSTIPYDLKALGQIRKKIKKLARENIGFALCTGRPQPYCEAMAQILDLSTLCVCENGAILYDTACDQYYPQVDQAALAQVEHIKATLIGENYFSSTLFLEIGNAYSICLKGSGLQQRGYQGIADEMARLSARFSDAKVNWSHSHNAIDITPQGINKGSGVRAVLAHYALSPDDALGIGDAYGDLSFLSIVGKVGCPSNASADVKALADYISPQSHVKAVLDIVQKMS